MTKNSFDVVWWFLTFQGGQNHFADPVLYENAINLISLLSLAYLNKNVPFKNWNSVNIDTCNDPDFDFLLITGTFKKVQNRFFGPGLCKWLLATLYEIL
jgi:hypothetical protein